MVDVKLVYFWDKIEKKNEFLMILGGKILKILTILFGHIFVRNTSTLEANFRP